MMEDLRTKIIRSIRLYLQDYRNTSFSKAVRKQSLVAAETIVLYVLSDLIPKTDVEGIGLLWKGFTEVHKNIIEAISNPDKLVDMNDAIGFLRILERN